MRRAEGTPGAMAGPGYGAGVKVLSPISLNGRIERAFTEGHAIHLAPPLQNTS